MDQQIPTVEEFTSRIRMAAGAEVASDLSSVLREIFKAIPLSDVTQELTQRRTDYINQTRRMNTGPLPFAFAKPEGTIPFEELRRLAMGGCYITTAIHARRRAGLLAASNKWSGARHEPGWVVQHIREGSGTFDNTKVPNYERRKAACEAVFLNPHPHDGSFSNLVVKMGEDNLAIDRTATNIIWNAAGTAPAQICYVDGSTIWPMRPWAERWFTQVGQAQGQSAPDPWGAAIRYANGYGVDLERYQWVQVDASNGFRPVAFLQSNEMIVGVSNPSPVAKHFGFGFSACELSYLLANHYMLAENYQAQYYTHGIITTILLLIGQFAGESGTELKAKLASQHAGPASAHVPPILPIGPAGNDLKPVSIRPPLADLNHDQQQHNKAALIAAIYNTDLSDLNMEQRGPGKTAPLSEGNRDREIDIKRDEGVLSQLMWMASSTFTPIVQMIDPEFKFAFVGLNDKAEQLEVQLRTERTGSYGSLNEGRQEEGKPALDLTVKLGKDEVRIGDYPTPMASALLQAKIQQATMEAQQAQQQAQMQQQQAAQQAQLQAQQQHQASMADQDHARRMQMAQAQQPPMDPQQAAQARQGMRDPQQGMPDRLRWPEEGGDEANKAFLSWYEVTL